MADAQCRVSNANPDYFFPERGQLLHAEKARYYCSQCPVTKECEDYRDRTKSSYGIWAGEFANKKPRSSNG